MPAIDLSILNQRQTPAFYADTLANRPAAGFVGRIFVSTDTFAFYRDNGTTWDLIGGPGTGTITGSGANGQVSYWNGASTITGSNDLFFDAVNGHLGIGTITPGTALDVKHDQSTVVQLEQVTATNDIRIAFINSGVGLWRLGAFYNAGANDFGLFDIAAATQPVTVKKTTGQVLIGTSTVGSGKLVVASSTGDNGVQIVGASAPSLRIDNAESGPTKRVGFGISTATNNFIQGSADRDFCMFNGSTTASPILFGIYDTTNVQEAARISAARNFLIGTTTDSGQKLQVSGTSLITGAATFSSTIRSNNTNGFAIGDLANYRRIQYDNSITTFGFLRDDNGLANIQAQAATFSIGTSGINQLLTLANPSGAVGDQGSTIRFTGFSNAILSEIRGIGRPANTPAGRLQFLVADSGGTLQNIMLISESSNLLIGTTTDNGTKLQNNGNFCTGNEIYGFSTSSFVRISGGGSNVGGASVLMFGEASSSTPGRIAVSAVGTQPIEFYAGGALRFSMKSNGTLNSNNMPTSAAGLVSGDIYSNLGVLTIVP